MKFQCSIVLVNDDQTVRLSEHSSFSTQADTYKLHFTNSCQYYYTESKQGLLPRFAFCIVIVSLTYGTFKNCPNTKF